QQLQAELVRQVPGRDAAGRAARRALLQAAFGADSLQALSCLPLAVLGRGLRALLARQAAPGSEQAPTMTALGSMRVGAATAHTPDASNAQGQRAGQRGMDEALSRAPGERD